MAITFGGGGDLVADDAAEAHADIAVDQQHQGLPGRDGGRPPRAQRPAAKRMQAAHGPDRRAHAKANATGPAPSRDIGLRQRGAGTPR